jgi:ABC-2 type transport system ATP-binding protein
MIELRQLRKRYGATVALDGIDLFVEPGELFAYLGPNGAGKSTTIRILTGLTRLDAGSARLAGIDVERHPVEAKRQCGLVMQHTNLDSELTVRENMTLHGLLFGMPAQARRDRSEELLEYVGLIDRIDHLVKTLSGGMKRRLMIARALLHSPRILFLDEPTVGLDAEIRRRIWALIKSIQGQGTTVFLTTHYIEEAEFLAGRVAFLDRGRIVALGAPQELMQRVGSWAFDWPADDGMKTAYFTSRSEAQSAMESCDEAHVLRRVNLEDAFLSLTGRMVE